MMDNLDGNSSNMQPEAKRSNGAEKGTGCHQYTADHAGKKVKMLVDRRAPLNLLEKFATLKKSQRGGARETVKAKDPSLENNPLRGRLTVALIMNSAVFFVFLSELVFNKVTFNGRCISKVLYPNAGDGKNGVTKPYFVELGYGACEYNLMADPFKTVFYGTEATDEGWPTTHVNTPNYAYAAGEASSESPNERIFSIIGGLNANMIRNYNETFRIFWAIFMHGSWWHLLFNIFCQMQALWIIEPDWGFFRTLGLFLISGVGGNLISAVLDPCGTTVGSSGAMYGLYGAMIPYCIEYWNTIPRPLFLLAYNIATLAVGFVCGMTSHIDNYAHVGGCVFGMLWGFATIKSVSTCDKCTLMERSLLCPLWSWLMPQRMKAKLQLWIVLKKDRGNRKRELYKAQKAALESGISESRIKTFKKKFERNGAPPCRMRLREWVIRILAFFTLILFILISTMFLFNPELYSKYSPPGQYKFSGWQTCTCCYVVNTNRLFEEATTPERYSRGNMFWCFNNVEHAKVYCGKDYGELVQIDNNYQQKI